MSPIGRMRAPSDRGERSLTGALAVAAMAGVLTITDLVGFARHDIHPVWAALQVPVLVLAWAAPVAWYTRRWFLAFLGLIAMLGGLWYLYLPPVVVLLLAGVALARAGRAFYRAGYDRYPDRPASAPQPPPRHALGAGETDTHGAVGDA